LLIIFDLDDTLIDTSGSIVPHKLESALRLMCAHGLSLPNFHEALAVLLAMNARSENTLAAVKEFLEIHDGNHSLLQLAYEEVYKNKTFDYHILPTKSAVGVLVELSKKHVLTVVTAGVKDIQMEKMKKAGIDTSIFSRIVVCEAFNKKIYYQQLIEDLRITPLDVVVCGDRVKRDLSPGKALGFKTVHMKWGRGLRQQGEGSEVDFVIESLEQMKAVIAQLEAR